MGGRRRRLPRPRHLPSPRAGEDPSRQGRLLRASAGRRMGSDKVQDRPEAHERGAGARPSAGGVRPFPQDRREGRGRFRREGARQERTRREGARRPGARKVLCREVEGERPRDGADRACVLPRLLLPPPRRRRGAGACGGRLARTRRISGGAAASRHGLRLRARGLPRREVRRRRRPRDGRLPCARSRGGHGQRRRAWHPSGGDSC